ncbi:DUF4422 domain-containing protein [Campylobacter sp. RM12654]|uniref:DUF4422 domain-containing protein n=1 Tax=Campylobacter sp. RM12654 TaxID=2735738 RepID=UPI0030154BF9|nr:DUF4422 domain-containing protein [Campylobacter sp. RM12654]
MSENIKIKILVGYHKPAELLKDDVLTPIHLGRALVAEASKDGKMSQEEYDWMYENMIGDDTGDNISHLNRSFCEMTGIYWAWKNYDKLGNPDYIGFMHYRRHFSFNIKKNFNEDIYGNVIEELIDDDYKNIYKLNDIDIIKLIANYDVISSKFTNSLNANNENVSVYEHYKTAQFHKILDFDKALYLLKTNYPALKKVTNEFINGNKAYFTNMFVMKKDDFFRYCEYIFDILFKLNLDNGNYSNGELRQEGFIAERLTDIYIKYLISKNKKHIGLQRTLVKNTDIKNIDIKPIDGAIPICFMLDENYLPQLSVVISSIKHNNLNNDKYDFLIFHDNIKNESINKFKQYYKDLDIRFFNFNSLINIKQYNFETHMHMTISTFFRLFLHILLPKYKKILYLDVDIVVDCDISELYSIQVDSKPLAAVKDIEMQRMYRADWYVIDYMNNKLKFVEVDKYFSAGVILFNLESIRLDYNNMVEQAVSIQKKMQHLFMMDQDILNKIFYENVKYIDVAWNMQYHIPIFDKNYKNNLSSEDLKLYENARNNPKIIHYCGCKKPWDEPWHDLADIWWKYARMSNYYEYFLSKILKNNQNTTNNVECFIKTAQPFGARKRAENFIQYKIGRALLDARNPILAIVFPITLLKIIIIHNVSNSIQKSLISKNPNLKAPKLEEYADYNEAVKVMNNLPYKLGGLFIKNPFGFIFKAKQFCREHKSGK